MNSVQVKVVAPTAPWRIDVLDGLRAVAILIVILSHAQLGHVVPGGFGVTIFFFLSGYLISTLLRLEFEKSGGVHFKAFYLRRTVRIIPPMLICYGFVLGLIVLGLFERPLNWSGVVRDLVFLTNYTPVDERSGVPILLWSLNVEEHFYLLFPAFFVWLLHRAGRFQIGLMSALILLVLVIRAIEFARGNGELIAHWTHTRVDTLLFGALLAIDQARRKHWGNTWPFFLLGVGLLLFSLVYRDELFRATIRYTVQGVGLFFVFKVLIEGRLPVLPGVLKSYPLKRIADWSYVLYLIHLPLVMLAGQKLAGAPDNLVFVVGIAASFAFAVLMERYVEKPLLRWRRRIEGGLQPSGALQPKGVE
jgi:peptidoglycan/LPS O-acetylase OafA/YrhL